MSAGARVRPAGHPGAGHPGAGDAWAGPVIRADGLCKRYGQVTALDGLSFDAPAGTVTALLGPNGSGKTTTVAILATALVPDSGQALICGRDVVTQASGVRASIGFAGQSAAVDAALTGRENLRLIGRLSRLSRKVARERAEELLSRFGLQDAADRLVRTYSGGMRRRLDVAAALAHRPPVLFLDEPTTGLDPPGRGQLWDMVRELVREGTTVLLTTQYLDEADALADHVVIIDRGRVAGAGTPQALRGQVGAAVVGLTFDGEGAAALAQDRLAGRGYQPRRDGSVLRLTSAEGSGAVVGVIHALGTDVPAPVAVDIREPSLDEVFRSLTGAPHASAPAAARGPR